MATHILVWSSFATGSHESLERETTASGENVHGKTLQRALVNAYASKGEYTADLETASARRWVIHDD